MATTLLIYGANGYTGSLIVRRAVETGLRPVLAGRDAAAVASIAAPLGLSHRAFGLDDPAAVRGGLDGIDVVLHCAGPFSRTWRPMVDACLSTRTHYLDITGEIEVFEGVAVRDAEGRAAGVLMMPGAGFDVVPSDCLAAHVARRLPSATRLCLAFRSRGGMSRGTARTTASRFPGGGAVRRGGRLVRVPLAHERRSIDFGDGPESAMAIPWGDVATATRTTGIPDVTVFTAAPRGAARLVRLLSPLAPLLLRGPRARDWLVTRLTRGQPGPSDAERARGEMRLWGEAVDAEGRRVVSRMRTPDGYTLTAHSAVALAREALEGRAPAGFQTPGGAFGADFVLRLDGVTREDVV